MVNNKTEQIMKLKRLNQEDEHDLCYFGIQINCKPGYDFEKFKSWTIEFEEMVLSALDEFCIARQVYMRSIK